MSYIKKYLSLYVILIIFCLSFLSCAKVKEDKIDGLWIRFEVTDINPEFKEYWTFKNKEVIIEREEMLVMPGDTTETLQRVIYEQGIYEVSANMMKSFVKLSGFVRQQYYTYNKKWEIINLDKEVFSLSSTVGNGAQYLEFYRE